MYNATIGQIAEDLAHRFYLNSYYHRFTPNSTSLAQCTLQSG